MSIIKAITISKDIALSIPSFSREFVQCVGDLLVTDAVQQLAYFEQHGDISRLQHSINVAHYSFWVCKLLHLNYQEAARAGLLHDLFFYHWNDPNTRPADKENHIKLHPKVALENARNLCALTEREEEIIALHMFPCCNRFPHYIETHIVSMVDKYCACLEGVTYVRRLFPLRRITRFFAKALL